MLWGLNKTFTDSAMFPRHVGSKLRRILLHYKINLICLDNGGCANGEICDT